MKRFLIEESDENYNNNVSDLESEATMASNNTIELQYKCYENSGSELN